MTGPILVNFLTTELIETGPSGWRVGLTESVSDKVVSVVKRECKMEENRNNMLDPLDSSTESHQP